MDKLLVLEAAFGGEVASVSDAIEVYGAEEVRKILFWDLKIFYPFTESIRAVFELFEKTGSLIKAMEIRNDAMKITDLETLERCLAEHDFYNSKEENAYFRILTEAAIIADDNMAQIRLIDERQERGL